VTAYAEALLDTPLEDFPNRWQHSLEGLLAILNREHGPSMTIYTLRFLSKFESAILMSSTVFTLQAKHAFASVCLVLVNHHSPNLTINDKLPLDAIFSIISLNLDRKYRFNLVNILVKLITNTPREYPRRLYYLYQLCVAIDDHPVKL
jgi:hypothetical protein